MIKSFARALAVGAAAALSLTGATVASATPALASSCITVSDATSAARGEIAICPQGDGTTRLTGWIEDLKPGWLVDGGCAAWSISLANGSWYGGKMACPHFGGTNHPALVQFDYVATLPSPATGAGVHVNYY